MRGSGLAVMGRIGMMKIPPASTESLFSSDRRPAWLQEGGRSRTPADGPHYIPDVEERAGV